MSDYGLTTASLALFKSLVEDAPNWSGTPAAWVSAAERGNLTDLKVKGLLTTFVDNGDPFAEFTDAGKAFAAELGYDTEVLA